MHFTIGFFTFIHDRTYIPSASWLQNTIQIKLRGWVAEIGLFPFYIETMNLDWNGKLGASKFLP